APAVAEVYASWFADRDLYAVRELWKLYRVASRRFRDLKAARRGLDFTDVLWRAVQLLERREEFSQSRFRLESRYHHLLIDEFQDTNDVQWRLVRALIDSWGEGSGLVQEAILAEQASRQGKGLLREPSIFIVGDRKQSIYGWRDARVEVMEKAARQLLRLRPGGGRRLTIRQSFRAEETLLDFLNDLFSGVPKVAPDLEWSFRYQESDQFPILQRGSDPCQVGMVVEPDLPRAAAAVGDEIVRLVAEEHARPKDIAILFRSRTHYRAYEEALADRGVPTYVYRGLGFFDSSEVKDIQALVRFLSEPGSELRSAELLRSRFIGVSDAGLARLAAERGPTHGEGPMTRLLRGRTKERDLPPALSPSDRAIALEAAANVPNWIGRVDRLPPADLVQEILDEADYAGCLTGRKGAQGWENLKKILEMLRRAQNRGYLTLSRLSEFLDTASTGDESLAILEAVDAVNLMTIHAAKGLEFETVFVVNMDQTTRTDMSLPRITEKPEGDVEVHALGRAESEGPTRSVEEEKRLLYVALTRARRRLVLCASGLDTASIASAADSRTTFLQLLPADLNALFQEARSTDKDMLDWTPVDRTHRIRLIRPLREPAHHRGGEEGPPRRSALEPLGNGQPDGQPTRIAVSELVRQMIGGPSGFPSGDPIDAAVGKIVHRMFEYALPIDDELAERAQSLAGELTGRTPQQRRQAAQSAAELYRALLERTELRDLLNASTGQIFREVPFSLRRRGQILRGGIDSLLLLDGRIVVIDYKTGAHRPEHRLQMEIYLEAARELFPGQDVEGVVFYANREPIWISSTTRKAQPGSQLELF
ncbi:MAG TPA: 3'-5' exonuclease, partial [Vicinamibacteria bacterium]